MDVRGAGTARIEPDEDEQFPSPDREEVRIEVDVDRASTWDFSDRMPAKTND